MSAVSVDELTGYIADGGVIAGIDLGTKTIGVAVSDRSLSFAHPRPVILRRKFTPDAEALLALFAREDVRAAVIVLPINMDGSEGPRAQATRAFVRNIGRLTDMPFAYLD